MKVFFFDNGSGRSYRYLDLLRSHKCVAIDSNWISITTSSGEALCPYALSLPEIEEFMTSEDMLVIVYEEPYQIYHMMGRACYYMSSGRVFFVDMGKKVDDYDNPHFHTAAVCIDEQPTDSLIRQIAGQAMRVDPALLSMRLPDESIRPNVDSLLIPLKDLQFQSYERVLLRNMMKQIQDMIDE